MDRHLRKERGDVGSVCLGFRDREQYLNCAIEDASFFLPSLSHSLSLSRPPPRPPCLGSCVSNVNVTCMKRFLFKSEGLCSQYFFFF